MAFFMWATNRTRTPSACDYYRIKVPLYWLEKLGYTKGYEDVGAGGEDDIAAMFTADIDLFYATSGEAHLHQIRTLAAMQPKKIQTGEMHYPPTPIWDIDDNPDYVHPFNQTFAVQGVRHYPTGEFLEPQETLEFTNAKGETRDLWVDKVTTAMNKTLVFDIARNLHQMKVRWEIMRSAVGVTCPSPALASYIKNVIGQPNVYVFPNTVVPEDYPEFPLLPAPDGEVRILWQGGMSHFIDWYPLREAIAEVMKRYPKAKLVVWGEKFDWITDVIPAAQLEFYQWTQYPAYKLHRGLFRADINLCPLANNPFNACKSPIKWYEGSIWSRPEATLAADVAPYREIKDGETGLLYKNETEFVQKLSKLIEDEQLRLRLGHAAKKWILENRTPQATIPGLFEFYQDCRARTRGGRIIPATRADLRKVKEMA